MEKMAETEAPIHELIGRRWSPYSFSDKPVEPPMVMSLLEAARWAPSSFNEQPWSFVLGRASEPEGFERLASCLVEGNAWAKKAPLLILSVAKLTFERNGKPNRHALHDVGLAVGNLILQGEALGLSTHQMAGFDAEQARTNLSIPEGFEPVAMIAVGHQGSPEDVDEALRKRDAAPRSRKPLTAFAFGAGWETPADL